MIVPRNKNILLTGSNIQVQTTGTVTQNGVTSRTGDVFVFEVTFEADPANTATVFVGCASGTGANPVAPAAALDDTNSLVALNAGASFTDVTGHQNDRLGEYLALSRYYVNGPAGQRILISYKERVLNS